MTMIKGFKLFEEELKGNDVGSNAKYIQDHINEQNRILKIFHEDFTVLGDKYDTYIDDGKIKVVRQNSMHMTGITVKLKNLSIKKLRVSFSKIQGHFKMEDSNLETLEGCPDEVTGKFSCENSKNLKSLNFSPSKVAVFDCSDCTSLTSLKSNLKEVTRTFRCDNTNIKTLEGLDIDSVEEFSCKGCKSLTSLKGAPKLVMNLSAAGCTNLTSINNHEYSKLELEDCINLKSIKENNCDNFELHNTGVTKLESFKKRLKRISIKNTPINNLENNGIEFIDTLIIKDCPITSFKGCPEVKSMEIIDCPELIDATDFPKTTTANISGCPFSFKVYRNARNKKISTGEAAMKIYDELEPYEKESIEKFFPEIAAKRRGTIIAKKYNF